MSRLLCRFLLPALAAVPLFFAACSSSSTGAKKEAPVEQPEPVHTLQAYSDIGKPAPKIVYEGGFAEKKAEMRLEAKERAASFDDQATQEAFGAVDGFFCAYLEDRRQEKTKKLEKYRQLDPSFVSKVNKMFDKALLNVKGPQPLPYDPILWSPVVPEKVHCSLARLEEKAGLVELLRMSGGKVDGKLCVSLSYARKKWRIVDIVDTAVYSDGEDCLSFDAGKPFPPF